MVTGNAPAAARGCGRDPPPQPSPQPTLFPSAGYASARHMKKYVGELRDFVPGTSGYAAYWVGDKITLRGHAKAGSSR